MRPIRGKESAMPESAESCNLPSDALPLAVVPRQLAEAWLIKSLRDGHHASGT
jgi:hypothetical protein